MLILLTIAAVISLALGLFQTFGTAHEPGEPRVEWVEGVAIIVAIVIVVLVGTLNDWQMERQFNKLNEKHNDRSVKVSIFTSIHPCPILRLFSAHASIVLMTPCFSPPRYRIRLLTRFNPGYPLWEVSGDLCLRRDGRRRHALIYW